MRYERASERGMKGKGEVDRKMEVEKKSDRIEEAEANVTVGHPS